MEDNIFWLKNWFRERGDIPDYVEDKNYFEIGLIDSFGIIELIESIEQEFGITFTQDNFQDRRFSTIYGLSEIMNELKKGGSNGDCK